MLAARSGPVAIPVSMHIPASMSIPRRILIPRGIVWSWKPPSAPAASPGKRAAPRPASACSMPRPTSSTGSATTAPRSRRSRRPPASRRARSTRTSRPRRSSSSPGRARGGAAEPRRARAVPRHCRSADFVDGMGELLRAQARRTRRGTSSRSRSGWPPCATRRCARSWPTTTAEMRAEFGPLIARKLAEEGIETPFSGAELGSLVSALGTGLILQYYLEPEAIDPDLLSAGASAAPGPAPAGRRRRRSRRHRPGPGGAFPDRTVEPRNRTQFARLRQHGRGCR